MSDKLSDRHGTYPQPSQHDTGAELSMADALRAFPTAVTEVDGQLVPIHGNDTSSQYAPEIDEVNPENSEQNRINYRSTEQMEKLRLVAKKALQNEVLRRYSSDIYPEIKARDISEAPTIESITSDDGTGGSKGRKQRQGELDRAFLRRQARRERRQGN
jgi:hypothetical protein